MLIFIGKNFDAHLVSALQVFLVLRSLCGCGSGLSVISRVQLLGGSRAFLVFILIYDFYIAVIVVKCTHFW